MAPLGLIKLTSMAHTTAIVTINRAAIPPTTSPTGAVFIVYYNNSGDV